MGMEIFRNEYIVIEKKNERAYLTIFKHLAISQLVLIIENLPTIKLTNFEGLNMAFQKIGEPVEIGSVMPIVELIISKDKLSAYIRLNCTDEDLQARTDFYVGEVLKTLHQAGITEGIILDALHQLQAKKNILIAKGKEPIDGKDAVVIYFSLSERKPTIRQDGKADFYDMNFIDEVKTGDWLGEKIPATNGTPGKTVTGDMIVPKKGKDIKLLYDPKTVGEYEENGKIILRALREGVVTFNGGKISVGDHLTINGDVGVGTGNIDFDGSLTITGVIQPGFSVKATKDISILGEMGLSGVKMVSSKHGDIFIKGGVFGQGESTIKAGGNIFVKHANDCILVAKKDIHIGYYSIGSYLHGRNVYTDEKRGKIIGGRVEAKSKVVAAIVGNRMERKTIIHVEGFNRELLEKELETELKAYKDSLKVYEELKKKIEAYENSILTEYQQKELEQMRKQADKKLEDVTLLDEKCKNKMDILGAKGEGEVTILVEAHPETLIELKTVRKRITSKIRGTFYIEGYLLQFQ